MSRPVLARPDAIRRLLVAASASVGPGERATLEAVWAHYPLGRPLRFRPLSGGTRGNSFVAELDSGQRVVLKRYKATLPSEAIVYEHTLLSHLEGIGFPAARLVRNREGGTCTVWNDRHYAAFVFIPGFCYTDFFVTEATRRGYIARAGELLARYHRSVEGFVPAGRKRDGYRPDGRGRWESAEQRQEALRAGEAQWAARRNLSPAQQSLLRELPHWRASLAELEQQLAAIEATLHKLPIHGDFSPSNLLCQRDGQIFMMDFECARLDLRAYDVAFSLVAFARRGTTLDIERARAFFDAYQATCVLSRHDVQWMPAVFRLTQLRALTDALRDDQAGIPQAARTLGRLQWVNWMTMHGQRLVDTLWA